MTNQFTGEQVEAVARVYDPEAWSHHDLLLRNGEKGLDGMVAYSLLKAREALEAAAGVAQRAPIEEAVEDALAYLEHLREEGHIDYVSYVSLHDHITAIATQAQPSSTVDEDALARVVAPFIDGSNHAGKFGWDAKTLEAVRAIAEHLTGGKK